MIAICQNFHAHTSQSEESQEKDYAMNDITRDLVHSAKTLSIKSGGTGGSGGAGGFSLPLSNMNARRGPSLTPFVDAI